MWMNRNDRPDAGASQRPHDRTALGEKGEAGMRSRWWLVVVCFTLSSLSPVGADIYRWRDEQGAVHFGNRPPANARDIQVAFKEIPSETPTHSQTVEDHGQSVEAVIQEFEAERRREEERARKGPDEVNRNAPATREDIIASEKERLEKKILELEQMPLEQFGSQRNKRAQIGFYEYRLQDLARDPEAYFKNPVPFEGNLPTPAQGASN
jgi:hypothetical protein